MQRQIIDLNEEVSALRGLHAAAALPRFAALCFVLLAAFLPAVEKDIWRTSAGLLAGAAVAMLWAHCIERGWAWSIWLLTAVVLGMTVFGIIAAVEESRREPLTETAKVAGGLLIILVPAWILASRGWRGARRRTKVSSSRDFWAPIPRDKRLRPALGAFALAGMIYIAGAAAALAVAVAAGGHMLIGALVLLPVARLGGRAWTRGRRLLALRVYEMRMKDTRAPVLLLRSFGDDNLPLEPRHHLLWFFHAAKEALTLEEFVVNQVWRIGPVVAIGNPRENLSPLGAARDYIDPADWQRRFDQYMNDSAYIVCVLGSTPGVRWEYEQLQAHGKQDRMLIVFPPRPLDELQRRWAVFQTLFEPAGTVDLQWQPYIGAPLLAAFSPGGEARLYFSRNTNETAYRVAFERLASSQAQ